MTQRLYFYRYEAAGLAQSIRLYWRVERLEWKQIVILPAGWRLTNRRTAIALAAAQELDRAGRHLVAGPVLAVVPGPDAWVLAAVAGIAAQLALDEHLRALLQVG